MSAFTQYLKDTRAELRHVAWPTRTQTIVFTSLVIAVSVFVSAYLGAFDYLFTSILERVVNANVGTTPASEPTQTATSSSSSPITITPIGTSTVGKTIKTK